MLRFGQRCNWIHVCGRRLEAISATSSRPGMVLMNDGEYIEVKSAANHKAGRGAATVTIEYCSLATQKLGSMKLPSSGKVERVNTEKKQMAVQYVDAGSNVLVASDENYEQVELPLALFKNATQFMTSGLRIGVLYHDEKPLKVFLPPEVMNKVLSAK